MPFRAATVLRFSSESWTREFEHITDIDAELGNHASAASRSQKLGDAYRAHTDQFKHVSHTNLTSFFSHLFPPECGILSSVVHISENGYWLTSDLRVLPKSGSVRFFRVSPNWTIGSVLRFRPSTPTRRCRKRSSQGHEEHITRRYTSIIPHVIRPKG
jgi:hypothetical protein